MPAVRAFLAAARLGVGVPVGYLSILTAAAWVSTARQLGATRHRPPHHPPAQRPMFALVVPAHDEREAIGAALSSMAELDYPRTRYRVHVVADHCTDDTVEIARAAGAVVHEYLLAKPGKGPALEWAVAKIAAAGQPNGDDRPDAFVFVDADSVVDPGLLVAFERRFAGGATAIQGHYGVRDPATSAVTGLRAVALASRHHLRPLGRTTIGGSCGLFGNGMAFSSELALRQRWSGHLVEDHEQQLELLLAGVRVAYEPSARVDALMPTTLQGGRTQNERWERGRQALVRRFAGPLARRTVRRGVAHRTAVADALVDLIVPPLSVLAAAASVVVAASVSVAIAHRPIRSTGLPLVGLLGWHVVSALILDGAPRAVWRSLAAAPRMIGWKAVLWLRVLVHPKQVRWVRTPR